MLLYGLMTTTMVFFGANLDHRHLSDSGGVQPHPGGRGGGSQGGAQIAGDQGTRSQRFSWDPDLGHRPKKSAESELYGF